MVPVCLWEKDLREMEAKWFAEDGIPERRPVILFVGQITERKNIHQLIEAFSRLSRRFEGWELEIRGPVRDPTYLANLHELVKKQGLVDRVRLLPGLFGEDLFKTYSASSIYCLPSRIEGMPTTVFEAMYFGGAIVAAASGAIPFQLDGGTCGLLFEPGDTELLTDHLRRLMSSEIDRAELMKKARERFLEVFTWEKYFQSVERELQGLIES
jgi:glycosyltransferase involved in cell wall biosynthesis